MIENAFALLFVLSLVAPAATIVLGVLSVAWPHRVNATEHQTSAHARV
jgi:hypothetical protein